MRRLAILGLLVHAFLGLDAHANSITGPWSLYYAWGYPDCSFPNIGYSGPSALVFKPEGEFSVQNYSGHWVEGGGQATFTFTHQNGSPIREGVFAVYTGSYSEVGGERIVGSMQALSVETELPMGVGCWYAVR